MNTKYLRLKLCKFLVIHDDSKNLFIQYFDKYKLLFIHLPEEMRHEMIGSMYVAFYYCISTKGKSNRKDHVARSFDYIMLYGLVDSYLDNPNVSEESKTSKMQNIKSILATGEYKGEDLMLLELSNIYSRYKDQKDVVKQLYKSYLTEVNAHSEQLLDSGTKTIHDYRKICANKGSVTIYLQRAMCGLEIREVDFYIGYLLQLCDDISDIDDDKKAGLNSLATYCTDKNGNIELLVGECWKLLELIKKEQHYDLIKLLVYHLLSSSKYLSEEYKKRVGLKVLLPNKIPINVRIGRTLCEMMNIV